MNSVDFNKQMDRLRSTYGADKYGEERIKILWREVKDFDAAWFEKTVDLLIGECAFAPLLPEFHARASRERERLREIERRKESAQAREFFNNPPKSDENMAGVLRAMRMRGFEDPVDIQELDKK